MPLQCPTLRTTLDTLALKRASLKAAIVEASTTGDFTEARRLEQTIEASLRPLQETLSPAILKKSQELMEQKGKEYFLGPEDIKNAFGFRIEAKDLPPIPFSKQELEEAGKQGLTLRLTWDTLPDGTKLTGKKMLEMTGNKQKSGNKFLFDTSWYQNETFFTDEAPERAWVLTGNKVGHKSQNFLEQTDALLKEVADDPRYGEARDAYEKAKPRIEALWKDYDKNWQKIARILADLVLTQTTRDSFSERLQQMCLLNRKTGKNILASDYYWTRSRSSGGLFVVVGNFVRNGAYVDRDDPGHSDDDLGVCLSRRKLRTLIRRPAD